MSSVFRPSTFPSEGVKRPSKVILVVLNLEKDDLNEFERLLKKLPGDISRAEKAIERKQALANDHKNPKAYSESMKIRPMTEELRIKKNILSDLPKKIKTKVYNVSQVEKELAEAKAREEALAAKRAAIDAANKPACQTGQSGDTPGGRKRKSDVSGEENSPKRQKTDAKQSSAKEGSSAPSNPGATRDAGSAKRPAPADDNVEPPSKRKKPTLQGSKNKGPATTSAGPKSPKKRVERAPRLRGLINHQNACFSGAVIQLLDAALDGHDVDKLLSPKVETEDFGLKRKVCDEFDRDLYDVGRSSKRLRQREETEKKARKAIKAAAKAGKTEKISPARHLRNVLSDLRADDSADNKSNRHVSPYLFQSVFAWGATKDVDKPDGKLTERQQVSGDTQEDAFEYYIAVMDGLCTDPHIGDADALNDVFEVKPTLKYACPSKNCGYKTDPQDQSPNIYHNITVPEKKPGEKCELSKLIVKSKQSETERDCPKCNKRKLRSLTGFCKLGDNLVIKVDRTQYHSGPSKVKTAVDLDIHCLKHSNGDIYDLSAVVCHKGRTTTCGHYTIFRKDEEDWYLLDDKRCEKTTTEAVGDSKTYGESALLLFKKREKSA